MHSNNSDFSIASLKQHGIISDVARGGIWVVSYTDSLSEKEEGGGESLANFIVSFFQAVHHFPGQSTSCKTASCLRAMGGFAPCLHRQVAEVTYLNYRSARVSRTRALCEIRRTLFLLD